MDLLERLRDAGWRLTPQRRVVAEALQEVGGHLTAEEVYLRARERLPEVSLATVYNALNELAAMGQVLCLATDGAKKYDANAHVPHQHLACVRCGRLADVRARGEDHLRLPAKERRGYELLSVEIVFKGICPDCRARGN
ncbi:MAG: transcriptional repressor [Acidobacteria bacterium]|nr:transcriptional repressor [Acidobacteriota bacterium]